MDVFEIYKRSRSSELTLLAACHGESESSLRERGVPTADIAMLLALADTYYGPTTFTARQRAAIEAVRRNAHSLATLHTIERCVRRTRNSRDAWALRVQLCATTGDTDHIAKEGARLLRLYRKQRQKPRQPGVRKYLHGELATLALTGKSHTIADMFAGLKQQAIANLTQDTNAASPNAAPQNRSESDHNSAHVNRGSSAESRESTAESFRPAEFDSLTDEASLHKAMLHAAEEIFFGATAVQAHCPDSHANGSRDATQHTTAPYGATHAVPSPDETTPDGTNSEGAEGCVVKREGGYLKRAQLHTTVVMTLDEATRIAAGDGDDITLHLTNGTTMTGAEYVTAALYEGRVSDEGHAVLVDALRGPVNAYRTQRFANTKQRVMALAENPTCAWPGCRRPGEECQTHHMEPWKYGGETNAENLVTLCAYHNGVNDDDPASIPVRGRMERVNGKIQRVFTPPERMETPWDQRVEPPDVEQKPPPDPP